MPGTSLTQAYVGRVLDLVDTVVDDVASVGPELGGITTILGRDVNITDLDGNIQARDAGTSTLHKPACIRRRRVGRRACAEFQ